MLLVVVLAAWPGISPAAESAGPNRPNVLIVICDQLNARALGCYGGPVPTPNIDRIAREGIRFDQAVCTWPVCSPSRASIITGMYPHRHGIVTNINRRDYPAIKSPPTEEGIKAGDVTTERLLHESGYATHHYGKWHLMDEDLPYYTDMFGEHHQYAAEMASVFAEVRRRDPATWMNWYGWALPVEQTAAFLQAARQLRGPEMKPGGMKGIAAEYIGKMGRLTLPVAQEFDVRVADKTVERIEAVKGRPFMITCSFNAPHDPNVTPSPYYETIDPAAIRLPANRNAIDKRFERDLSRRIVVTLGEPGVREFLRIYFTSLKLIDDQVGRLLRALEATGQLDNTVVVFTADHGDMLGGHGMIWKSTEAFYDEIARVPLLVRYPPLLKPQPSNLAVDSTDLMPTLLEIAGRPVPSQAQGQSLVPYLTGRADASTARRYCFCERVSGNPQHLRLVLPGTQGSFMVRGQGWKYIRYDSRDEYLYNLREDPAETKNLSADPASQPRKRQMIDALEAWQARTDWPR